MPKPTAPAIPADAFRLYGKPEYYDELVRRIEQCGRHDRIALATLSLRTECTEVERIMDALCATARRGARVDMLVDAFTFLGERSLGAPGPLWFSLNLDRTLSPRYQQRMDHLRRLADSGGRYTITNMPTRRYHPMFLGRSHIKFGVINNYVFLGGCNLTHTDVVDLMVGWEDQTTADTIYDLSQAVAQEPQVCRALHGQDQSYAVDPRTTLYIDAGVRRQSIIFEQALALIDEAQEWLVITCQYFPNGVTARHLLQAQQRGVKVRLLYAHPSKQGRAGGPAHHLNVTLERLRMPREFFQHGLTKSDPLLHAKLIATEQGAIIGSHNYVQAGVRAGTAEIALLRRDPAFAQRAVDKIDILLHK